jgi:hypothetical protein
MWTDRQTDRQMEKQKNFNAEKMSNFITIGQINKWTNAQMDK